ncbi:hypothetical protein [Micrococcus luteus]|uniref:hypothetical protein n=1 Tax=Micrococcus luteus TaxID=1270 RepID=UPI0033F5C22E
MLAALASEISTSETKTEKAKNLVARLETDRLGQGDQAGGDLTLQIPDFDKLVELVKPRKGDEDSVRGGLEAFRDEFRRVDLLRRPQAH